MYIYLQQQNDVLNRASRDLGFRMLKKVLEDLGAVQTEALAGTGTTCAPGSLLGACFANPADLKGGHAAHAIVAL